MMKLNVVGIFFPTTKLVVHPTIHARRRDRIRRGMVSIVHEERIMIWDQGIDDFYGRQPW